MKCVLIVERAHCICIQRSIEMAQSSTDVDYTPHKTTREFMLSDAPMRALMGPVGSGKSVACSVEVVSTRTLWAVHAYN